MKFRSIAILLIAEIAAMSLWFVSAAILPDMLREVDLSAFAQAALSSGVQAGFVAGALLSAIFGLADRFDPRRVFAICAITAGATNALLLIASPGSAIAILARVLTGVLLAGVYPVGMKIAVGWGDKDRGFLVGSLVGALTLGSALPHLMVIVGGSNWQTTIEVASIAAILSGILCLFTALGPHHGAAAKFDPKVITNAWTNRRVRLAYAGYLGHMWELYAMWAWLATATAVSYSATIAPTQAEELSRITAFVAIASGGITCIFAGKLADKIGKARISMIAMILSGSAAIATALTFGGAPWVTFVFAVIWGMTIIPDSAQFSALVADAAPADQVGSLMTFQTALGFTLTFFTVQATPYLAQTFGWPLILAAMAIGPAFGVVAMAKLQAIK